MCPHVYYVFTCELTERNKKKIMSFFTLRGKMGGGGKEVTTWQQIWPWLGRCGKGRALRSRSCV